MDGQSDNRKRLARLLDEVAVDEGVHRTRVEGVQVVRRSQPLPRTPIVYAPKLLIVGQGFSAGLGLIERIAVVGRQSGLW